MDKYLEDDQQQELKNRLYSYLKDKAMRRADVTSKRAYEGAAENFQNQKSLHDIGALAGALSEAGSMMGQIQGVRAKSDIVPTMNKNLYDSTQNAYENYRTLRGLEEQSNMNDVNVARYISGIEQASDANKLARRQQDFAEQKYADLAPNRDLQRKKLEQELRARKFQPGLYQVGTGAAATLDQEGNPQAIEGFKEYRRPVSSGAGDSWEIVENTPGPDGQYLLKNKRTGETKVGNLPPGFSKIGPKGGRNNNMTEDGKRMTESSIRAVSDGKDAFRAIDQLKPSLDKFKSMMGPLEGNFRSINKWDTNAQKFKADLKRTAQIVGKFLEGGVLRKEDEVKYEDMLPSLGDVPETAEYKLNQVRQMLVNKQNEVVRNLKDQGYATGSLGIDEKSGANRVHVHNPKTGEEFFIDRNDLPDAQAEGFEEVQ